MLAQLGNQAVSDVPGHGDEIRPQRVRPVDDGVHKWTPDRGSNVQVTELQNPKAGEVAGKISDRDSHANDERPSREYHADEREERRRPDNHQNHRRGGSEPEEIGRKEGHDQQRRQPHRRVRSPVEHANGEPAAIPLACRATGRDQRNQRQPCHE